MTTPTRRDRVAGGIWGLLIGDAVGVPYEFIPPEGIPPIDHIDMRPPPDFRRSHPGVAIGTWSDDGAHALCLFASLLERGRLDPDDLMRRLLRWREAGYMTPDGAAFDIGIQTSTALSRAREGTPALECGPDGEQDNGNGSLMRVLPLALWHRGSDEELVSDAHLQSRITHGHPRSQVCCALYCLSARRLLRELDGSPWDGAVATLREIYGAYPEHAEELEHHVRPDEEWTPTGSGYVLDCLRSAFHALGEPTYGDVIRRAVSYGQDTDTTASVAGGLAGIRDGVDAIPIAWRARLRSRELVEPMIDALLEV